MRSFRIPIFILLLTLFLCLYAGSNVSRCTDSWKQQLMTADGLVCNAELTGIPLVSLNANGVEASFQTDCFEDFWQAFVNSASNTPCRKKGWKQ